MPELRGGGGDFKTLPLGSPKVFLVLNIQFCFSTAYTGCMFTPLTSLAAILLTAQVDACSLTKQTAWSLHWLQFYSLHWLKFHSLHWMHVYSLHWLYIYSLYWLHVYSAHYTGCMLTHYTDCMFTTPYTSWLFTHHSGCMFTHYTGSTFTHYTGFMLLHSLHWLYVHSLYWLHVHSTPYTDCIYTAITILHAVHSVMNTKIWSVSMLGSFHLKQTAVRALTYSHNIFQYFAPTPIGSFMIRCLYFLFHICSLSEVCVWSVKYSPCVSHIYSVCIVLQIYYVFLYVFCVQLLILCLFVSCV